MDIFRDYSHQNVKTRIKNKEYLRKKVSDRKILEKEFKILQFLNDDPATPQVQRLDEDCFLEEYITGRKLTPADIKNPKILNKVAEIIQRIHSRDITAAIKPYIKNSFLEKEQYSSKKIGLEILANCSRECIADLYSPLVETWGKFDRSIAGRHLTLCLIHGDLSFNNFLRSDGDIYLIDWTDCRFDAHTCDVSQLFYLMSFASNQKKYFLDRYCFGNVDEETLAIHRLLLVLYDFVAIYKTKKIIKKGKLKELQTLIKALGYV